MTTATDIEPYDLTVPELFHREQIITQLIDGDEDRQHPLTRVVVEVKERSVLISTPSAPSLGLEEWGQFDHPLSELRPLTELLPPRVGTLDHLGQPRTNRTLVNRLGIILAGQRIPNASATTNGKLSGQLSEGLVFVGARFARYTCDLIKAYLPYDMEVRLREERPQFAGRRVIVVTPRPQQEA